MMEENLLEAVGDIPPLRKLIFEEKEVESTKIIITMLSITFVMKKDKIYYDKNNQKMLSDSEKRILEENMKTLIQIFNMIARGTP